MADSMRKEEEGTTTCLVEGEETSTRTTGVAEEAEGRPTTTKTKKTRGANTMRRKKLKKLKEQEALQKAAEAKTDDLSPRSAENIDKKDVEKGTTKSEGGEGGAGTLEEHQAKPDGKEEKKMEEVVAPATKNEEKAKDEEKNENEAEGSEKPKTKKKAKKEKKDNTPQSPRTAGPDDGEGEDEAEKKKKKKKKKKPKTPRGGPTTAAVAAPTPAPSGGGGSGIGAVTPLKLDEAVEGGAEAEGKTKTKTKKGAQTERTRVINDPPLSAVRAGPVKSLASSSSGAAPPSPSAGVKFAQRLSLANVIPKLSTLPFEKKPRVFNSNTYAQPFSGKTLVKWMLEAGTGVKMDLEAMILGELMLNAGVIVPLSRKVEFSASGKDFYALTESYSEYTRPRGISTSGPPSGFTSGSMIGGRAVSNDETRRLTRRSSVMLTFRSISMRGLNHLTGFAKEKEKKDDESDLNLVYGKSLEEVMALQMQSHPDEKVPIILKTLTKAIIDTQGHKTEGIFRVPGKNDEISRLKAQFNKMDYTITSDDPNDLGGCLKMWFRELKDPLIPNDIYDECVLVANNPADCLEMVNTRVPELNKTVIYFLLGFLQEMSRHAGVTRMGSANLGMVFAPGLLRCEDVMKMMTNTAHEGAFVKNLIEHYRPAENN